MSWNNIVDKIYVITTSDKPERFKEFIKNLPFDHNLLKVHTMVKRENFENEYFPNRDCEYAHKMVAQDAFKNDYNRILVFEDDARLSNKITPEKIAKILSWIKNNDWDILYLGHICIHPSFIINDYIIRTNGSLETHAICYNRKIIQTLINIEYGGEFDYFAKRNHKEKYYSLDNFFRLECPYVKAYAVKPTMFYQNNYSIDKKNIREKFGLFKNSSEENFDDNVNDTVLFISFLIIFIPLIIILSFVIMLCRLKF
jgi:hypothetical protein